MNTEVVLTCAVTGAGETAHLSDHVPVTPEQIANACLESAEAGASIAHLHVRDPKTGKSSNDIDLYTDVVERIRADNRDIVINITAGMGGEFVPDTQNPNNGGVGTDMLTPVQRLAHIVKLKPEICTLDCGSLNFSDYAYVSTPAMLREMAKIILDSGVRPEIEAFELGHLWMAKQLISEGLIEEPALFQFCHGIPFAAEATMASLQAFTAHKPDNCHWSAFALGRMEMPFVAASVVSGGNVRVGLEDNLYLSRGVLATNAQLVEKAKRIIEDLGARVLSPEETRQKWNLKKQA